jgi:hypothetical protein
MSEHKMPLPLKAIQASGIVGAPLICEGEKFPVVASVLPCATNNETNFRAEFIVTACNAHAALLEALKEMAEWYGSTHDPKCPADDTCDCSRKPFNDRVNAAIALAEKTP